jgi:uncharacterized repeat protein (TIGR04076 family)
MSDHGGYRVVGTVTAVKGKCSWGHKVGDKIELSGHNNGGLCGVFYHDIYPYIVTLETGGSFPTENPDVMTLECMDRLNAVTLELHRLR